MRNSKWGQKRRLAEEYGVSEHLVKLIVENKRRVFPEALLSTQVDLSPELLTATRRARSRQ